MCENKVVHGTSKFLSVGYSEDIGKRDTMEDELVLYGCFEGNKEVDYFALFDGHGGNRAARFASKHLHKILAQNFQNKDIGSLSKTDIRDIIRRSFLSLESKLEKEQSGCTALVCLVIGKRVFCANCGDSRAILFDGSKMKRISHDHKPDMPEEKERIIEAGGFVVTGLGGIPRVNAILSVARGFGDSQLGELVPAEPYISVTNLDKFGTSGCEYIVMACDGLWDVFADKELAKLVNDFESKGDDVTKIAKCLVKLAIKKGTTDNVSVVVIKRGVAA